LCEDGEEVGGLRLLEQSPEPHTLPLYLFLAAWEMG
jgi:hypothetical protein